MFKFMNVLRKEVWYGILGAVIVVSILLWALDRFSPYSYYNNKEAYPEGMTHLFCLHVHLTNVPM